MQVSLWDIGKPVKVVGVKSMLSGNCYVVENAESARSGLSSVVTWRSDNGYRGSAISLHYRINSLRKKVNTLIMLVSRLVH